MASREARQAAILRAVRIVRSGSPWVRRSRGVSPSLPAAPDGEHQRAMCKTIRPVEAPAEAHVKRPASVPAFDSNVRQGGDDA